MRIDEFLGLDRDLAFGPTLRLPSAAAGSAADYEGTLLVVPDLTKLASTGRAGALPLNALRARLAIWTVEATLTGAATNNFAWQILHKRAGALLVNTNTPTAVAAPGSVVITPASMANIFVGTALLVDSAGNAETVIVAATTATTFTATFAQTHSSTWTIVSAPLAAVTYANGTNETAFVPRQTATQYTANAIHPGDILTFKRVSSNATGLASPAVSVQLDLVFAQGRGFAG
jgi:hypothetical protein